ncbi:MAG: hypothetical protein PVF05_04520 [Gemmatimonadales bacterium]
MTLEIDARKLWMLVVAVAAVAAVGCGDEAASAGDTEGAANVEGGATTADAPEPTFDEAVGEDDCAVLTLSDVAAVTGVSADDIEQRAMMGTCTYAWDGGNLNLLSARVHDSVDRARRYFSRFTEDVTAEDIAAAKKQFREELDEEDMDEGEKAVAGAMAGAMEERDIGHRPLPGLGSEAVMDSRGSVYIRYGNLTMEFAAKNAAGDDVIEPDMAMAVGRRMIANVDAM